MCIFCTENDIIITAHSKIRRNLEQTAVAILLNVKLYPALKMLTTKKMCY